MSLIVIATIAAASLAAAAGAAIAARRVRKRSKPLALLARDKPDPVFDMLQLQVGDVVMRGNHELWLVGALVLTEGAECVGAVFHGSKSAGAEAEAVVVRPGPPRAVAWVQELPFDSSSVVADCIEAHGERLTRKSRIPVAIACHGEAWQQAKSTGLLLQYEAPSGSTAFVLCCDDAIAAWCGCWLAEGSMMRLAAGKATFRED
jgi:hypothetical protein